MFFSHPACSMAILIKPQVIATGTILPALLIASIIAPCSDPELRSARNRSPAEKWTNPCSLTRRAHWVPLPAPGPLYV